ncbi:hypothetical protein G7Y89_g14253 [Cudoniella acicularis]|uniref:Protein kinase domain-containing protein n=1 Tax=Cudoniella acicularis TaxID=354080 RepID=A0A8H4R5H7_9HELO|nr:hypothetical protein G7Y89_g14253 [Cudoniella acicularis]
MDPTFQPMGYDDIEDPEQYCEGSLLPVHLGDRLGNNDRYNVLYKFGNGGLATTFDHHIFLFESRISNLDHLNEEEIIKELGELNLEPVLIYSGEGHELPNAPQYLVRPINSSKFAPRYLTEEVCIDFGESYPTSTPPKESGIPLSYSSPEILFHDPAGIPSDIWALACTLFGIRSGNQLFQGMFGDTDDILMQMVQLFGKFPEPWWSSWENRQQWFDCEGNASTYLENGKPTATRHTLDVYFAQGYHYTYHPDGLFSGEDGMKKSFTIPQDEIPIFANLLGQMLTYDPVKRITVAAAVADHEYSGRGSNAVALATKVASAIALNRPLLQQAVNVINVTFAKIVDSYIKREEITTSFSGCSGTCSGTVKAPGLAINCTEDTIPWNNNGTSPGVSDSTMVFQSNFTWAAAETTQVGALYPGGGGSPFPEISFIDFSLVYTTERQASFRDRGGIQEGTIQGSGGYFCNGTMVMKWCSLRSATLNYPKYTLLNYTTSGSSYATYYESWPLTPPEGDDGIPIPQVIIMEQTSNIIVFKSNYNFLAGALAVMVIGVLIFISTFYGFWELGRDTSLNPLEVAKAFNSAILEGTGSNASTRHLNKSVGAREVQYGEIVDKGSNTWDDQLQGGILRQRIRRLELADPNRVIKP